MPLQDIRPEYIHYSATYVEWLLTFSGIAFFFFLFFLFSKFLPIVSVIKGEEGVNYTELRKDVIEKALKEKIKRDKRQVSRITKEL